MPTACIALLFLSAIFLKAYAFAMPALRRLPDFPIVRIPRRIWSEAADQHQERVRKLLQPGLTPLNHALNSGIRRHHKTPDWVTTLDQKHPIYNFLIEYYGVKGAKGVRRLSRWSPSPGLLLQPKKIIETPEEMSELSRLWTTTGHSVGNIKTGILLEGASDVDFSTSLHRRGAIVVEEEGIVYCPSHFFGKDDPSRVDENARLASPFLWYERIIRKTSSREPVLHCFGLHEWAMQYQPSGAPPPPSAKYQSHLPLRVSRGVINDTVERRGVACTHIDALKYFAQGALPLNQFGGPLTRNDQVQLEQPACVHGHMDLLKMVLKLVPFCDASLVARVLEVALESRRLDLAGSPYDVSAYEVDVIPIETSEGRFKYRTKQLEIMRQVAPIRHDLLLSYQNLIAMAFNNGR